MQKETIKKMPVRYKSLADGADAAFKCESSIDKILSHGNYTVEIEHNGENVGLPVEYCGSEHYIVGTLVVTDSGTMRSGNGNRAIGQELTITLRHEKETKVFTRTFAAGTWSEWHTFAPTAMCEKIADDLDALEQSLRHTIINYNEWKATDAQLLLPNILADEELAKMVKSGTILTFKSTATTWKRYQYTAASTATANVKSLSNWKELSAATYSIKQAADANKVQISTTGENGGVKDILNISAATTERAGVMSAEDKKNLNDNIIAIATETARAQAAEAAAIEQGRQLALRELYIAAGALYNNSGVDIPRIAPWGDSVIHKAGHYYLNGLGDITEEEMKTIYTHKDIIYNLNCARIAQSCNIRTIFPLKNALTSQVLGERKLKGTESFRDSSAEILVWHMYSASSDYSALPTTNLYMTFANCSNLRIIGLINVEGVTEFTEPFTGCSSLERIGLYHLNKNVSFKDSPQLNMESVVSIISSSQPTSAITITLHADAYARLAEDADIVAALEVHPLVSLVSM